MFVLSLSLYSTVACAVCFLLLVLEGSRDQVRMRTDSVNFVESSTIVEKKIHFYVGEFGFILPTLMLVIINGKCYHSLGVLSKTGNISQEHVD